MGTLVRIPVLNILFSQNISSFILCCFLISKAYDYAPTLSRALLKKLGLTDRFSSTRKDKYFGRFRLPLAQCMFFGDTHKSSLNLKDRACEEDDNQDKNLRDLFDLIKAAQREILICCYVFTYAEFAQVIMEAYDRNVNVKVITGFDKVTSSSEVSNFQKKGIKIKMTESSFIFHHKFIILDRTVLINGSTNFSTQGMLKNIDSLLVTSDPFFVKAYTKEFNFLWNSFTLTY